MNDFQRDGYVIVPQVLTQEQIAELNRFAVSYKPLAQRVAQRLIPLIAPEWGQRREFASCRRRRLARLRKA